MAIKNIPRKINTYRRSVGQLSDAKSDDDFYTWMKITLLDFGKLTSQLNKED